MTKLGMTLLAIMALLAAGQTRGADWATIEIASGTLAVQPRVDAESISVAIAGPNGFALSRTFGRGEAPTLALPDTLADGIYFYDVRLNPAGRQREAAEVGGSAKPSPAVAAQSGHFNVRAGVVSAPDATAREPRQTRTGGARATPSGEAPAPPQPDDFLINDDLVVVGSTCSGFDCVNNELFGLENFLGKQNNNRLRMDDTSVAGGFPATDWQLRFNDDSSGGLNRFAVEDLTGARLPLSIVAGAPNNSVFVDTAGNVGLNTGAPVVELHMVDGDTPDLRLEQDGSSGFTPQTWDVAGNESSFFIRDVTNGGALPLRVRTGVPSSALDILGPSGNVGLGTSSAAASLHVFRNNASAQLRVEEATASTASRNLLRIVNNGASTFRFDNTATGLLWGFGSLGSGNFFIGATPGQPLAMQVTSAGNMIITGAYSSTSDRDAKTDVAEVDAQDVLARVAALPLSTWRFKQATERHIGPMAQDFAAAFGLGSDDKHIALGDVSGVALAAIQALKAQLDDRDVQLRALHERLAALEAAVKQE